MWVDKKKYERLQQVEENFDLRLEQHRTVLAGYSQESARLHEKYPDLFEVKLRSGETEEVWASHYNIRHSDTGVHSFRLNDSFVAAYNSRDVVSIRKVS